MASSQVSHRSPVRSARPRYGREQPRIWTPPLRRLTRKTTHGFDVIDFAEQICGIELYPWQKWLLVAALELLPDNSFRFRTVVVLVARQSGKSTLGQILALWFMYRYGAGLVLGTAQDLDVAEQLWQGAVDLVDDVDELRERRNRVVLNNGRKSLELKTGERYKVKAANRRAGRGLSGDLILLDELREHQSWDSWGAITKTTMARPEAQVWALSNAGDASSIVLRYLRKMGHAAIGDPDGINDDDDAIPADDLPPEDDLEVDDEDTLGIFEWSAPPGCDLWDRAGWAQANPALGYSITERTIGAACKTDPEWIFRTEVLCQWSDGTLEGPFPPGSWAGGLDEESRVAKGEDIALCVDVSWDRSTAHIGMAGLREDGLPHVGILASRAGTDWVVPWLQSDQAPPHIGVVVQSGGSPAASLVKQLAEADIEVVEWTGADLGRATGAFYDAVRAIVGEGGAEKGLRHRAQPLLDVAAATAVTRPMGDAYVWDRKKSPTDIAPLVAVTGALWALMSHDRGDNEPFNIW